MNAAHSFQIKSREEKMRSTPVLSRFIEFWRKQEFLLLLSALLCLLFVPAFVLQPAAKSAAIYICLLTVIAASLWELKNQKRSFIAGIILSMATLLLNAFDFSENEHLLFLLRMMSLLTYFGMLIVDIMNRLANARRINANIIYGVVNGYLLIGMIGGMGFRLINHFYSNSFMLTNGLQPKIDDFTYFSFITLSTLGYGDITPTSPPAQALAILLSVIGPMYTAIVIGIIIGKFHVR